MKNNLNKKSIKNIHFTIFCFFLICKFQKMEKLSNRQTFFCKYFIFRGIEEYDMT